MRIAPAAKAFVYARANPVSRNVAFTALRMMSSAAPAVKVRVGNRFVLGCVSGGSWLLQMVGKSMQSLERQRATLHWLVVGVVGE